MRARTSVVDDAVHRATSIRGSHCCVCQVGLNGSHVSMEMEAS